MATITLAADLGGTNLRMAVVGSGGEILHRSRAATPPSRSRNEIVAAIVRMAGECMNSLEPGSEVSTFGLAVPAIISSSDGTIFSSPNLPDLNGFDMASDLANRLKLQVVLENDANAAAAGENWLGASRGVESSLCVTLGTGVGGGLFLGGRLIRGIDGTAGEVGHITVEPDGYPCGCGSNGCLEQYASATAILHLTREFAAKYPDSPFGGGTNFTPADVYEAGKNGDPLSLEVFESVGRHLGIALAGLINVLNLEIIVLGGGASAGWDLFIEHVRDQIRKRAFRQPGERARLVRAKLGDAAGILGAAKVAFEIVPVG
ncbi:MAG TPA: ROK family protein [Pyrinomonadaceae bacterium]|nr:ROK family protein [Pyrinomonadaceae bacterium]